MLGDTLTITVNAVSKVMKKINQDSYSAEYLLRETTQEFRTLVRHSNEKGLTSGQPMDRHNVLVTQTIFPSETYPTGKVIQVGMTIRNAKIEDSANVDYLVDAAADWAKANGVALANWES